MKLYRGKAWIDKVEYNSAQYNSVEGVEVPAFTTVKLTVFLSGDARELKNVHRCKVKMLVR